MTNETKRLTPEAEREIAGRVNPQYSDTPGTESHERALLLSEIQHLRQERDAMAGDLAIALRKLAEIEAQEPVPNDDIPFRDDLARVITQAIADARREGAEAAAAEFDRRDGGTSIGFYDPHEPAEIIRALPLLSEIQHLRQERDAMDVHRKVCDKQRARLTGLEQQDRALPMRAEREPVLLTDAEARQLAEATLYRGSIYQRVRAIEAAVLAKNGLEAAR